MQDIIHTNSLILGKCWALVALCASLEMSYFVFSSTFLIKTEFSFLPQDLSTCSVCLELFS